MTTELENALRSTFDRVSDGVVVPDDLAGRVRRRHAIRRRRSMSVAATVAVVGGAVGWASVSGEHRPTPTAVPNTSPLPTIGEPPTTFAALGGVTQLAVSGNLLYVAGDGGVRAYDRTTGALRSLLQVPEAPNTLRVGPDGGVWITLYPDSAHDFAPAIWRLSPDLSKRSVLTFAETAHPSATPFDVLPTGPTTAIAAMDWGLARITMPSAGHAAGTVDWRAFPKLPTTPTHVERLSDGRLLVTVDNDARSWLMAGGAAGWTSAHDPRDSTGVTGAAVGTSGVWVVDDHATGAGLLRLNDALQPMEPGDVAASLVPATGTIAVSGAVVWVSTGSGLTCIRWVNPNETPSATVPLKDAPEVVAATANTVYVPVGNVVRAYPVPPVCRG